MPRFTLPNNALARAKQAEIGRILSDPDPFRRKASMAMAGIKDPEQAAAEEEDAAMRRRVDKELLAEELATQKAEQKAEATRLKAAATAAKEQGFVLHTDPETGVKRAATAPNGGNLKRTQNANVWVDDNEGKAWTRDHQGNLVDAYEKIGVTKTDPKTGRKIQS